jgi:hypothetical protein
MQTVRENNYAQRVQTKPGMGFFSFKTAWRTLQGFEIMNMIRKGQIQDVEKAMREAKLY